MSDAITIREPTDDATIAALRARVAALESRVIDAMREGFELAVEYAEVSEHDGWHRVDPFVDWGVARKALDATAALAAQETKRLAHGRRQTCGRLP